MLGRFAIVVVVTLSSVALVACGDDDDESSSTQGEATEAEEATDDVGTLPVAESEIVGASLDDATAALEAEGYSIRVIRRDGEDLPATADYVPTRVNVAVETGDDGVETVTEIISLG